MCFSVVERYGWSMSGKPGKQALHIEAWLYGLLEQRAAVEGRTVEDLAQALIGNGLIAPHATSAEHLPEEPSKEPAGYVDTVVVAAGEENWVKMFMHGYWDCIQVSETRSATSPFIEKRSGALRTLLKSSHSNPLLMKRRLQPATGGWSSVRHRRSGRWHLPAVKARPFRVGSTPRRHGSMRHTP